MGAYGGTAQASLSPYEQTGLPGQASRPDPADGAVEVETNVILSWTPGAYAVSHDVYFGTDLDFRIGIEDFRPPVRNQTSTQFDPGRLNGNTTYFWRIDEVNSNGKRTGVVWQFTTTSTIPPPPKGRGCFIAETDVWVDGALVSISKIGMGRSIRCVDGFGMKNSSMPLPCLGKVQELQEHEGVFECYDVLLQSGNRIGVAGYLVGKDGIIVRDY
jgi:hypothetical protein